MNQEYEVEQFGFSAEQFTLERNHFLRKIISRELDDMVNKFNASKETSELLNKEMGQVFANIWESMSVQIMLANNLDKKYFSVPNHVLLPAYFDHVKSYTEKDEQQLDEELEMLKKMFLENSIMMASLKLENSQYKDFSAFVDDEIKAQQKLKDSFNSLNINKTYDLVKKTKNIK